MAKIAIITGAGSGVGKATALAFLKDGWNVALAGRRKDAIESVARESGAGERALCVPTDVAKQDSVKALFAAVKQKWGRIDCVFNNAGVNAPGVSLEEMPLDKWQRVIDANLTGAFLFSQAAGRDMLKRDWGRIINIASIAGLHGLVNGPHYVGYAASKAGLMGLTRELAVTWGKRGIRVEQAIVSLRTE